MEQYDALKLPDEAIKKVISIFEKDTAKFPTAAQGEGAVFAVCNYVAKYMQITLEHPTVKIEDLPFLAKVETIAKASQVRMRQVMLQGKWWEFDAGPIVATQRKDGTPCALIPDKHKGYQLISSQNPKPQNVTAELAKTLNRMGCIFYRPFPDTKVTLKKVLSFGLLHQWSDVLHLFSLQATISLIGLIIPVASGIIIDTVIPTANFNLLGHFVIALTVMIFAITSFKIAQVIATMRLKLKSNLEIQSAVWDRALRLPLSFFRNFTAGDLAIRLGGIDDIQQKLTGPYLSTIISGIFSLFALALMFFYDAKIGTFVSMLAFIGAIISLFYLYIQVNYQRHLLKLMGESANLVYQFITGIAKLRAHAKESRAFLKWSEKYAHIAKAFKDSQTLTIGMVVFQSLFRGIFLVLFFTMVVRRIGTLSLGSFVALNAAVALFITAFTEMFVALEQILKVIPLYERIQPILLAEPEIKRTGLNPGQLEGDISLRNLSFYYNTGDPFVFTDFNIEIKQGQFVALVGPSGSGKSTLFRLLLGFESPLEGKIRYDGKNLAMLNIQKLRQQIGVVLQNCELMPGTILENILGGNSNLDLKDAWYAAKLASIDQYIETLPMGMHTLVSEGGSTFSMGQRQRFMLARALVNRPRILFLDEATSALDNTTQRRVQDNLEQLSVTQVVAAHRLSTIVHADCIYVLNEKGRIVQQGTCPELLKQKGLFLELIQAQIP
ncbi:MAG: NHLP bacteriocin export ABC transporter permease/ATPase subunit [Pseudomonadota bacterium]